MIRPWAGCIARVNTETVDGRIVRFVKWDGRLRPGVVSSRYRCPIGGVNWVGTEGTKVFASGWINISKLHGNRHPCGIDLDDVCIEQKDLVVIRYGKLQALTIYDDDWGQPAWPECHIKVFA